MMQDRDTATMMTVEMLPSIAERLIDKARAETATLVGPGCSKTERYAYCCDFHYGYEIGIHDLIHEMERIFNAR